MNLGLPIRGCLSHRRSLESRVSLGVSRSLNHHRIGPKWYSTSHRCCSRNPGAPERLKHGSKETTAQRDFFFDVLNVNATRRDAKQYLARFKKTSSQSSGPSHGTSQALQSAPISGVNLGWLYRPTHSIETRPTFTHETHAGSTDAVAPGSSHIALVTLRALDSISDAVLDGIALTLSQLVRLDMRIVVILDGTLAQTSDDDSGVGALLYYRQQSDRLVGALADHNGAGAQYVDSAIELQETMDSGPEYRVAIPSLITHPLTRSCIPVIPGIVYTVQGQAIRATRSGILQALTRFFARLDQSPLTDEQDPAEMWASVDRLVMIDPLGGVPSFERPDGAHVFVNLQQEYEDVAAELQRSTDQRPYVLQQHLQNLKDVKDSLALLPPSSSALIISPEEASGSAQPAEDDGLASIRTRRQKNPLIHNLLTNRPVVSSSLPAARLSSDELDNGTRSRSTLVKQGMPLMIIPNPRESPWRPPLSNLTELSLDESPNINFPRLLALIEDSFRRPLDVHAYLQRVKGNLAGIIIAGEYEGGAILTWESPPGGRNDPQRLVPYLDKFAVLQKSQGNAGVADIVFQAMVRSCFPHGVCWRSRSNNPVNKWYFERSAGSWKLPGGQWTMFWTTPAEDLLYDRQKWLDYVAACQGVVPTWADGKRAD